MKIADAEYCGKLWAIDVHLLNGDAKKGMPKWLESWSIFRIVFNLNTPEKVLERRIYRAASGRTREFVFTEMERVIKFRAYIFVEIDTSRQIKAAQRLLSPRTSLIAAFDVSPARLSRCSAECRQRIHTSCNRPAPRH
jgi:hypothetical protein